MKLAVVNDGVASLLKISGVVYAGNSRFALGRSSENLMKLAVVNGRVASFPKFLASFMVEFGVCWGCACREA